MRKPPPKKWEFKNSDFDSSLTLASEAGVSPFAAQLLINRGIKTAAEARAYLHPTLDELHSPFKLADMDKAIERIHTAISRGEKICIYGDYDTDGTTATALLLNTFRQMGGSRRLLYPQSIWRRLRVKRRYHKKNTPEKESEIADYRRLRHHVGERGRLGESTRYRCYCHGSSPAKGGRTTRTRPDFTEDFGK